jgi:hypothetical protein
MQSNNQSSLNLDESNKNDEDLLSFSNKYQTTIYKDEEECNDNYKDYIQKRKISADSTTNSLSQEYSNLSINSKRKNNNNIKDNNSDSNESKSIYEERKRKISSPICFYYNGSDEYLSKIFKNNIDINNSNNFVKKEDIINKSSKIINHININNMLNNVFYNNLNYYLYKNDTFQINVNNKQFVNNNNEKLSFNNNCFNPMNLNFSSFPKQSINDSILQQQLYNLNYINFIKNNFENVNKSRRKLSYNNEEGLINNYFNNILNQKNNFHNSEVNYNTILLNYNNIKNNQEKDLQNKIIKRAENNKSNQISKKTINKKSFDRRKGDWFCPECNNLNFAFRIICNKCKIPKPKNINSDTIVNKNQ